jgi:5-methyltetrahydropteroyltriglutamate--homocysteine methyltransferase
MIPTEPIGSVPRPRRLLEASRALAEGGISPAQWSAVAEDALRDTLRRFEETGSPVVTDGEQTKPSFATYPVAGLPNLAPDGVVIPFADGHTRRLPRLTAGPFRYATYAGSYVRAARRFTRLPIKQAVIAPSALSLLYPAQGIASYPRERFLEDLLAGAEADIRDALSAGADSVQIDFTEGRLAVKLDPSKALLESFVDLLNRVLGRFSTAERARIGVHTCPGGDRDSTHSADVPYAELLPDLFRLDVGRYYLQFASEKDRAGVLAVLRRSLPPGRLLFLGVTDPLDPRVERPEEVRDLVLEAARVLPRDRLGTCDDCGFSPFADDDSTSRDVAFGKIRARVEGTRLAAEALSGEVRNGP